MGKQLDAADWVVESGVTKNGVIEEYGSATRGHLPFSDFDDTPV